MKVVKVISSGPGTQEVITDEDTTRHIRKQGSRWMYLAGFKASTKGDPVPVYKEITMKGGK